MAEASANQSALLAEAEITGTVKTAGSIRIDGKLDGELHCGSEAVVGKGATVKGNIVANSASIAGTVTGNIIAKDRLELKSSARVTGDIKAKRLAVEDGVVFVGKSEVNPSGPTGGPEPTKVEIPKAAKAEPTGVGMFGKR